MQEANEYKKDQEKKLDAYKKFQKGVKIAQVKEKDKAKVKEALKEKCLNLLQRKE